MKVVNESSEIENLFPMAKLEAKKYFNNDKVYIEKYFKNPRHIEVQILSGKNRTVHLNERDCSVQRKHQKLIEETPSPVIDEKIRSSLLEKTGYNGVYHVLGGLISPLDGIGPDELNLDELLNRAKEASEIIIATDASIEGDTTSLYISKILDELDIKITRLARGLPVGGHLEYVDEATLTKSMHGRVKID